MIVLAGADVVLPDRILDDAGAVVQTWVGGQLVYARGAGHARTRPA